MVKMYTSKNNTTKRKGKELLKEWERFQNGVVDSMVERKNALKTQNRLFYDKLNIPNFKSFTISCVDLTEDLYLKYFLTLLHLFK